MGTLAKPPHPKLDQQIGYADQFRGTATELEAIPRALDDCAERAQFEAEMEVGFNLLVGVGGFIDAFGSASE